MWTGYNFSFHSIWRTPVIPLSLEIWVQSNFNDFALIICECAQLVTSDVVSFKGDQTAMSLIKWDHPDIIILKSFFLSLSLSITLCFSLSLSLHISYLYLCVTCCCSWWSCSAPTTLSGWPHRSAPWIKAGLKASE